MKIVMMTGSAHRNGTTATLATDSSRGRWMPDMRSTVLTRRFRTFTPASAATSAAAQGRVPSPRTT